MLPITIQQVEKLVDDELPNLILKNVKPGYKAGVQRFVDYLATNSLGLTREAILGFLADLKQQGFRAATINVY